MTSDTQRPTDVEQCPWCQQPLGPAADPVRVLPERGRATGERLHHDCAAAWEGFIDRARRLAASGHRWTLLDRPLERGWEFETGGTDTGTSDRPTDR
jgi:hypothetical protein